MSSVQCISALVNINRVMLENYDNEIHARIRKQQLYEDWQNGIRRNATIATTKKNDYKKLLQEKFISGFYVLHPWQYNEAKTYSFSENPYVFIGEPKTGPIQFTTRGIDTKETSIGTGTGDASTNYVGLTDTLPDPNISGNGNLNEAFQKSGIKLDPNSFVNNFVAYSGKLWYYGNARQSDIINNSILPVTPNTNPITQVLYPTVYQGASGSGECYRYNDPHDKADHKMCSLGKNKSCNPIGNNCGAWDWSPERNLIVANPLHWTELLDVNIFQPYMNSLIERKNKNIDAEYAKINADNEAKYKAAKILPVAKQLPSIGCCQSINIDNLKATSINLDTTQTCNIPSPQSALLKPLQNFRFL
jgi:hypothetical protein